MYQFHSTGFAVGVRKLSISTWGQLREEEELNRAIEATAMAIDGGKSARSRMPRSEKGRSECDLPSGHQAYGNEVELSTLPESDSCDFDMRPVGC
jgi:hypothetical protein